MVFCFQLTKYIADQFEIVGCFVEESNLWAVTIVHIRLSMLSIDPKCQSKTDQFTVYLHGEFASM